MKKVLLIILTAGALWFFSPETYAQTNSVSTELNGIIARVNQKLVMGKTTESDLAENLKEFDTLYARHKGDPSADVAEILVQKANVYLQVLNNPDKALDLFKQVKHDFPSLQINGNTDAFIAALERMIAVQKSPRQLSEGSPFPDFSEKDTAGKPLSVANYKGKVVLIDFWATWCPPCQAEMPNVVATYQKYHDQGFEVIGITLDDDRQKVLDYTRKMGMVWPQYFDGQGWGNKLVVKYGVQSIPATYLLDGHGKIIGHDLRGNNLVQAVAKALAAK